MLVAKLIALFTLSSAFGVFCNCAYYAGSEAFAAVTWHAAGISATLSFFAYVVFFSCSYDVVIISVLFIFGVLAVLVVIRGGAPRYRLDQLAKYNFDTLLPVTAVYASLVVIAAALI